VQKFHHRWVLHALWSSQKSKGVGHSSLLCEVLEEAQRIGFELVITANEFWFFLSHRHNSAWATSPNELPERGSQKIDTEQRLISISWSVNGTHTLLDIPKGSKYNTAFVYDFSVQLLIFLHSPRHFTLSSAPDHKVTPLFNKVSKFYNMQTGKFRDTACQISTGTNCQQIVPDLI
jgi:hypothetical protein